MGEKKRDRLEKRIEKLITENQSLRKTIASLKKANSDLKRFVRDRDILFNSMPAGTILIQQGKVLAMNEILLEQLGYESEEVIGRDFLDFVHPDLKGSVKHSYNAWNSTKSAQSQYEVYLVTRNGETIYCDLRIKRIRFKSRTTFLLNLTRMEKRKEMEREAIQSRKREALINMASGLNRRLRLYNDSLLEKIKNYRAIASADKSDLSKILDGFEDYSNTALGITRQLEVIAGKESTQTDIVPFRLNEVINSAIISAAPKWKEGFENYRKNIDLKTYMRSSCLVEGDPKGIQDVIIHVINNSVEAMPYGGEIHITTEENAGYAHIYIQDSGVGIPDRFKDRVIDPFFTTKGDDSTGLGLSLSYAIVKRHKGDIEISSLEDQGTIVNIRLPLARQPQRYKPTPDREKFKNAQILIIQQEDVVRELLSHSLTSKGCEVDTAMTGLEGLGKLKRKKFDLVIADTMAPYVDENAFLTKIRKLKNFLPIVLIRGNKGGDNFNRDIEQTADLNITRPIELNGLVKQITELLTFKRQ